MSNDGLVLGSKWLGVQKLWKQNCAKLNQDFVFFN